MTLVTHEIPGGAAWSLLLRRGRSLTLTALGVGANCSTLIYPAYDTADRLNVPDTLKAQMSARIRPPMVLMSDRGVGLASVTGSSLEWHDCLGGHSVDSQVPPSSYAAERNDWRRSARDLFLVELAKYGRTARDLHGCVNFFAKVATGDDGSLIFVPGHAEAGDWVTLRAEVDLLLIFATSPHPMDPAWAPASVRAKVRPAAPYDEDDPSMTFRDESARALQVAKAVFA